MWYGFDFFSWGGWLGDSEGNLKETPPHVSLGSGRFWFAKARAKFGETDLAIVVQVQLGKKTPQICTEGHWMPLVSFVPLVSMEMFTSEVNHHSLVRLFKT